MIEQQIKMELLVRGLENKANNCIDLVLPTNDEDNLKKKIELVCDKDNSVCCVVKTNCNCKIKLDDKVDILELNQKLIKLNELCSANEVTAVSEYIGMKKSTIKEQEDVSIDEIINKVKEKDYKFYTMREYLDRFDEDDICSELNCYYNRLTRIFDRLDEHFGIFDRFESDEILSVFEDEELVEFLADGDYCTIASTGVIEEIEEDDNKKE